MSSVKCVPFDGRVKCGTIERKSLYFCSVRRKRRRNERTAANIITNMLRKGKSPEEIADMTGEDLEEIQEIQKQLL